MEEEACSDEEGGLAPVSMSPLTPSPEEERNPPEEKKEVDEKGEKILNRISSLDNNPADSKGLEKLSTIEDDSENKEGEEEGESGEKKKIV